MFRGKNRRGAKPRRRLQSCRTSRLYAWAWPVLRMRQSWTKNKRRPCWTYESLSWRVWCHAPSRPMEAPEIDRFVTTRRNRRTRCVMHNMSLEWQGNMLKAKASSKTAISDAKQKRSSAATRCRIIARSVLAGHCLKCRRRWATLRQFSSDHLWSTFWQLLAFQMGSGSIGGDKGERAKLFGIKVLLGLLRRGLNSFAALRTSPVRFRCQRTWKSSMRGNASKV